MSGSLYSDDTYENVREKFKADLYYRQGGIMSYEKYNAFIEPYLEEAERSLEVSVYMKDHPKTDAVSAYLYSLLSYNVAQFHRIALSQHPVLRFFRSINAEAHELLEKDRQQLLKHIQDIKQEGSLYNLDPEIELNKTSELFYRANLAFYEKSGIGFKLKYMTILLGFDF